MLNREEIERQLLIIMAEAAQKPVEAISRDALIADAGIDSMSLVEMVFQVEDHFGISIPFNANTKGIGDAVAFNTVGDVLDAVTAVVLAKQTAPSDAMPTPA